MEATRRHRIGGAAAALLLALAASAAGAADWRSLLDRFDSALPAEALQVASFEDHREACGDPERFTAARAAVRDLAQAGDCDDVHAFRGFLLEDPQGRACARSLLDAAAPGLWVTARETIAACGCRTDLRLGGDKCYDTPPCPSDERVTEFTAAQEAKKHRLTRCREFFW